MRSYRSILLVLVAVGLLLGGCAEERSLTDSAIQAHSASWMAPASSEFHGSKVARDGVESCRTCHGEDLRGKGAATDCSACHNGGAGGHPASQPWLSPLSDLFHGKVIEREGNEECSTCHGADFRGGWSEVSCYLCHAGGPSGHQDGWLAPSSSTFHGRAYLQRGFSDCARCHGSDFEGGTSGLACSLCHG